MDEIASVAAASAKALARRRTKIMWVMCLATLMAQLDTSVVNLAAKRIGVSTGAGVSALQWVIDAYNLAYATLLLTGGALGDAYGRRRMFILGLDAFTAGLALLPLSVPFLVVSRRSGALAQRLGPRAVMGAGMALMGAGLSALACFSRVGAPLSPIEAAMLAIGAGLGLNGGPVMAVAVAHVPPGRSGTAAGLGNTARMIGATLGVAVLGAVFAAYAGQRPTDAAAVTAGLRAAFAVGAAAEFFGALVAVAFIRGDSLIGATAGVARAGKI